MITLEQVKQLDLKVTKAVEYIKKLTGENALLRNKLDSNQKRIDDLEVLIKKFKEDQSRIEDGILSALDRLNQFEDAVGKSLAGEKPPASAEPAIIPEAKPEVKPAASPAAGKPNPSPKKPVEKIQAETPLIEIEPVIEIEPEPDTESSPDNELDIF